MMMLRLGPTARRSLRVCAQGHPRQLGILRDAALRAVTGRSREDIENDPDLWVSASAVEGPGVSVLEPIAGYARSNRRNGAMPLHYLLSEPSTLPDPFALVHREIGAIMDSIRRILGSDNPVLSRVARYFFELGGGKKVRPTMVLLVSQAAAAHRTAVGMPLPVSMTELGIVAAQQRLAEITEMIHTASLLHDDVVDESDTRRGVPSVNKMFGDKLSVLAGDFLLARSSICLARLRNVDAIELMSTAIEHLVKGEVMQIKRARDETISPFEYYLRKNYYKTGSLMANSCRAALELGKHEEDVCELGFAYGRHLGLAFQLIDDVLDYDGVKSGKPLLADLKSGLSTAPLLLAQEEYPLLGELATRKFREQGDIELAYDLVQKSSGISRAKALAMTQAELACQAIMQLSPSPARSALVRLAQVVSDRSK